ncbi:hypothetical protein [Paracoccus sp. SSK6]|uniref:hypothetical protein n=1 Tax=Paracoccus sp. SSK6 TaxID=3143131 RepID=UPI00321B55E3
MRPATMALAYRIWGDCRLHGWSRTVAEIADSLGEDPARVRRVAQVKNWLPRMRMTTDRSCDTPLLTADMDGQIDRLAGDRRYGAEEIAA